MFWPLLLGRIETTIPVATLVLGVGVLGWSEYARRRKAAAYGTSGECPTYPPWPSTHKLVQRPSREMQDWASSLVHNPTTTFGQTFDKDFGDRTLTARVEHHSWTTKGPEIIPGCFKGVTLYEPKAPLSEAAGAFMPSEVSPLTDCAVAPWQFPQATASVSSREGLRRNALRRRWRGRLRPSERRLRRQDAVVQGRCG